MTQQHDELKPGAKQEAGQKLFDGRESVDLIELGLREDIDWEAEGQLGPEESEESFQKDRFALTAR